MEVEVKGRTRPQDEQATPEPSSLTKLQAASGIGVRPPANGSNSRKTAPRAGQHLLKQSAAISATLPIVVEHLAGGQRPPIRYNEVNISGKMQLKLSVADYLPSRSSWRPWSESRTITSCNVKFMIA